MAETPHPEKIDRFVINSVLGKGAQGIVYLATDPSLKRQVAIKAVNLISGFQHQEQIDQLLSEARTVSQLQHPNIVSIYDVGSINFKPYLILEYVEGETLQNRLKRNIGLDQNLNIIRDVLTGVSAAHDRQIIHCDLKPANILLDQDGHAKVADFGLAQIADANREQDESLFGTPHYMAPEYIETQQHQTVSDVFSLGLIFYEMLTGERAVKGNDIYQILNVIANQEFNAPSKINSAVDERLDAWLLNALAKDPAQRYANATAMLEAFKNYMSLTEADSNQDSHNATLNFLLRRIRHKKDFPAFSQTLGILNSASTSDTESMTTVANAILKDFSLTNKILRLINSAYYSRGGGKVSTISRAVIMLGINPVRNIAASLMLFEHLQNKQQAFQLKENAVMSMFSALVARDLAVSEKIKDREEAFLCAMLQQLGKMLVSYYLHEESQAIDRLCQQKDISEASAAAQILGISYHQLGMSVAAEWGFPGQIIDSMKPYTSDEIPSPKNDQEQMKIIARFSNSLGETLQKPLKIQAALLKELTSRYSKSLNISEKSVSELIQRCHKDLTEFAKQINFDISKSKLHQQLTSSAEQKNSTPDNLIHNEEFDSAKSVKILKQNTQQTQTSVDKTLTDGIQDITNTLTSDFTINQIMEMILETIYRAFDGCRVLLCLRNAKTASITARFGYGDDIDNLIPHFVIPLKYHPDVFHISFKNNVDIRIENTSDEKIRGKIPAWYYQHINARSFTIFPIIIKHSPIALIYIDSANGDSIGIDDNQLGLLKTLRNQAILALKTI